MKTYGDLHCDTLWKCYRHGTTLEDATLNVTRKPPFEHLQTYAIYIPDGTEDPFGYFKAVYAYGQEVIRRYPEMVLCHSGPEIDAAFAAGKTPYLYSIEGGGFFDEDLVRNERIAQKLKAMGIVFMSICYNEANPLAHGTKTQGGLTELGKKVALLLRDTGITVDISHLNHQSTDEMLDLLPDRVIATHSNCYALKAHPRNLTDEQIQKIIARKGLIGVNFCHHFLSSPELARISNVVDHIRHILRLGGEEAVAIGGDFDGLSQVPVDLPDLNAIPALADALEKEFGAALAHQILYGNMKAYLDRTL